MPNGGEILVGGACVCAGYELRITGRCLTDDLGYAADTTFADALAHDIVRAFRNQRAEQPIGTRTVGPDAGENTLHRLGLGHDHRGATWFDDEHSVVWLCAYGLHRSGAPDDAFQHFRRLIDEARIRPTAEDYEALFADWEERFVETARLRAQQLLEQARDRPEEEIQGTLGDIDASIVVVVIETLQETYVAVASDTGGVTRQRMLVILKAFYPEAEIGEWSVRYSLPTRDLDINRLEVCWAILHGIA